jgi:excisionase family DNA binding protein
MTLVEAAKTLGITPDSLRQAIARGTLKASKRGRDWWVTEKQLKQWRSSVPVPSTDDL